MWKYIVISVIAITCLSFAFIEERAPTEISISGDDSVAMILEQLGEDIGDKKPRSTQEGLAQIGEDIVKNGFSKRDGLNKSRRQSKHFVCTSCHNLEREDPDLSNVTPQARLEYVVQQGLPYLQGTTLYGAVNRETYYNGDYDKKYGDLVEPARNDIREAIQLCAQECAQGRKLKDWELEAILAYLWTIDLKISDLTLSELEISSIAAAVENDVIRDEAVRLLKRKYPQAAEATFLEPPADRKIGTGYTGDKDNGKLIYDNSCLHCHYQKRYSFLHLDDNKMSFSHLDAKADTWSNHSIYQVVRYGTYSKYGKKSYMPNYTKEKMSEQQLADLRAYIAYRAKS